MKRKSKKHRIGDKEKAFFFYIFFSFRLDRSTIDTAPDDPASAIDSYRRVRYFTTTFVSSFVSRHHPMKSRARHKASRYSKFMLAYNCGPIINLNFGFIYGCYTVYTSFVYKQPAMYRLYRCSRSYIKNVYTYF